MNLDLTINKAIFIPAFYPYLQDYSHRYELYIGGAGSGKSVFVGQKLVIKALSNKRKILIIRKVGRTIQDSVFQNILDCLSRLKILAYCNVNKSTFTITLPNESVFLFKGLDESEKIKSIVGITDIWCEEASELSENDFSQLDLRLRANVDNLQIFLTTNPISKVNFVYQHWFANGTPNETIIHHSTYKDNPFLPQTYIDSLEAMKTTNPTYYRIYALGEFCSLDKLVYTNWEAYDTEPPQGLQLIVGLDWGYSSDETALIVGLVDEVNKTIYITDEHYQKGMLNTDIANMIKYKGLSKSVIVADSAEPKSIEELRQLGIYRIKAATKGPGSINQGIQKIQQYKLLVKSTCSNTITELQNYSYKKDKHSDEYTNEPQDSFNHLMDALRYAIQTVDQKKKLQSLSKTNLGI